VLFLFRYVTKLVITLAAPEGHRWTSVDLFGTFLGPAGDLEKAMGSRKKSHGNWWIYGQITGKIAVEPWNFEPQLSELRIYF
jgi:hypothetical protein